MVIRTRGLRDLIVALFAAGAAMIVTPAAQADPTGAQSALTAITGQGEGLVIVSPTSALHGNFNAHVKVTIHGATPDTIFTVTRAVDTPSDGVCTSTNFGTVATLQTSSGGAGAVEFERNGGPTQAFDLFLRVIGADGTVLQSG